MTIVGLAGSESVITAAGSGITFTPPSFTLILNYKSTSDAKFSSRCKCSPVLLTSTIHSSNIVPLHVCFCLLEDTE